VVRVVLDNLNTHRPGALYKAFPAEEARRILRRLEFHYTPAHASWLNMVEIEIGSMNRQCLDRRIPDWQTLEQELSAWEARRNEEKATIEWLFNVDKARAKLTRAYQGLAQPSSAPDVVVASVANGAPAMKHAPSAAANKGPAKRRATYSTVNERTTPRQAPSPTAAAELTSKRRPQPNIQLEDLRCPQPQSPRQFQPRLRINGQSQDVHLPSWCLERPERKTHLRSMQSIKIPVKRY
jgi:hypothetical protein